MAPDQTILITGAAGALGRVVARAFLTHDARLVLVDREVPLLANAFPDLAADARHLLLAADVTSQAAMGDAAARAIAQAGRIHGLVHIAGGFTMGQEVHQTTRATWDGMMNLNAWSFVCATGAVVPHMLAAGGGRIVAVTARAALKGGANMGAYAAAKSALQRLVESLSAEARERGINVNSVAPSLIDTPANRKDMPDADFSRWVAPEKLAETIVFLCSDTASAIHGQHLLVEGLS